MFGITDYLSNSPLYQTDILVAPVQAVLYLLFLWRSPGPQPQCQPQCQPLHPGHREAVTGGWK